MELDIIIPGMLSVTRMTAILNTDMSLSQQRESLRSVSCRCFGIPNTTKTPPLYARNGVFIITPLRPLLRVHRYARKPIAKFHFSQGTSGIAGSHGTKPPSRTDRGLWSEGHGFVLCCLLEVQPGLQLVWDCIFIVQDFKSLQSQYVAEIVPGKLGTTLHLLFFLAILYR